MHGPQLPTLGAVREVAVPRDVRAHSMLLLRRQQRTLLVATFGELQNVIARAVWAGVEPLHRRVVPFVLEQRAHSIRGEARSRSRG
jgi:hypothetical protein